MEGGGARGGGGGGRGGKREFKGKGKTSENSPCEDSESHLDERWGGESGEEGGEGKSVTTRKRGREEEGMYTRQ